MENLPIFFESVKHHAPLCAIISTGSFPDMQSIQTQYSVLSDKAVELKNFQLSQEDRFHSVVITLLDSGSRLEFKTENPKYFQRSNDFFGVDGVIQRKNQYLINDNLIEVETKNLGSLLLLGKRVFLTLRHYTNSHYSISLLFPAAQKTGEEEPIFYVEEFFSHKNIIGLFKPDEVSLVKEYSFNSNAPIIRIKVENPEHPVLKYYKQKASLLINGNRYENNQIPMINPLKVEKVIFTSTKNFEGKEENQLEVVESNHQKLSGGDQISYRSVPNVINYFYINEVIATKEELQKKNINLENYKLLKTVFGKDAYDEFGKPEYSSGVAVYIKN